MTPRTQPGPLGSEFPAGSGGNDAATARPRGGGRSGFLPPALLALAIILSSGVAHGLVTGRWQAEAAAAGTQLEQLPLLLGDWQGEDAEIDAEELRVAGASAHVARTYVNRTTGDAAAVVVLCGKPGPLSVHTPLACYAGVGYEPVGGVHPCAVEYGSASDTERTAQFWAAELTRERPSAASRLRALWSWSANGQWLAPDNPRLAFVRSRSLFKLYVIRELRGGVDATGERVEQDFLRQLLPALDVLVLARSDQP
jgi:hypothetical protein